MKDSSKCDLLARFRTAWTKLAACGACEEVGGQEYLRIRAEWMGENFPVPIAKFIRERANVGPQRRERE